MGYNLVIYSFVHNFSKFYVRELLLFVGLQMELDPLDLDLKKKIQINSANGPKSQIQIHWIHLHPLLFIYFKKGQEQRMSKILIG